MIALGAMTSRREEGVKGRKSRKKEADSLEFYSDSDGGESGEGKMFGKITTMQGNSYGEICADGSSPVKVIANSRDNKHLVLHRIYVAHAS